MARLGMGVRRDAARRSRSMGVSPLSRRAIPDAQRRWGLGPVYTGETPVLLFQVEGPDQVVDDLLRHGDVAADGLRIEHRFRRVLQHLQLVKSR
jgi:hypothetical protein